MSDLKKGSRRAFKAPGRSVGGRLRSPAMLALMAPGPGRLTRTEILFSRTGSVTALQGVPENRERFPESRERPHHAEQKLCPWRLGDMERPPCYPPWKPVFRDTYEIVLRNPEVTADPPLVVELTRPQTHPAERGSE